MVGLQTINNKSEIKLNNKWILDTKFNDRLVDEKGGRAISDYKGRQYRVIEKVKRNFSSLERFGRGFLESLAVVCALFLALFSKSVKNLFTKSKENICCAIRESDALPNLTIPNPNNKSSNRQPTLEIQKLENAHKKEVSKSVTIGPVSMVSVGIYTAEGRTEKGENIYFGMEMIDNTSREVWRDYSNAAYSLCDGILRGMVRFLDDESKLKNLQQDSGLSKEEFKDLAIQFRKRGLHPQGKLAEAISDIPGGIVGFMIESSLSGVFAPATYVAYISKMPITGPLSLPKTESNLKIFKEKYKNILMSVGVRLDSSRPFFENRGIFRNPISVIEGGYSNIATQLHAFTGKVMKECVNQTLGDKQKLYMSVSPIKNMKELLVKKIGWERIKTKQDIPEELRIKSSGIGEQQFLISLEDLVCHVI